MIAIDKHTHLSHNIGAPNAKHFIVKFASRRIENHKDKHKQIDRVSEYILITCHTNGLMMCNIERI